MVVGAFPAAKLGTLLLKQVSKPIANVVKTQAKSSPIFRKYVCMPPAQFYNWCEIKAKMWILNLGKPVNIPVLSEAMAIELGANLLGEGIIFLIAAGILISEYGRSSRKETAKEEAKQQEMEQLHKTIQELFIQSEEQGAHIRELTRKIGDLDTKLGRRQLSEKSDSPKDPPKGNTPVAIFDQQSHVAQKIIEDSSSFIVNSGEVEAERLPKNVLLRAVNAVENEFWNFPQERKDGILTLGLYHVYQNVFKVNL